MRRQFLFIIILSGVSLFAQNLDLLMKYNSGYYASMGGTGLASVKHISSMDMNPAELSNYSSMNLSVSQGATYYGYDLLRISSLVGEQFSNWNECIYNFDHVSFVIPTNHLSFGIGIYRKLSPHLINKKIAVTFSDLFSQETNGDVYSVTFGLGYKPSNSVLLGISFSKYFGELKSIIRGENHDIDLDKWVSMENDLSGFNFKCGLIYVHSNWSAGFTIEAPFKMKVKTSKHISDVQKYKYLLPHYDATDWHQPLVIASGVSYYGINGFLIEADFEIRKYKSSDVQINLFEFGGLPIWQDLKIFRIGVEYKPADWNLPLKAGYAVIPQLYYSNNSFGLSNIISSYQNTDQNIKHSYTVGTTLELNKLSLDFAIDYSVLKWNRTLIAPQIIEDDYKEKNITFSIFASLSL